MVVQHLKILGFPDHGTFAEYPVIHQSNWLKSRKHLSKAEAAAAISLRSPPSRPSLPKPAPWERILSLNRGGAAPGIDRGNTPFGALVASLLPGRQNETKAPP